MSNVANHTPELIKRIYSDLTDVKREQLSQGVRIAAVDQHLAANQVEIARLSGDIPHMNQDVSLIKRRLDLVDA
jgi:streptomycin 6-kinase